MVESQSVVTFLLMLQLQESCYEKVVVRSVLLRLSIPLVRTNLSFFLSNFRSPLPHSFQATNIRIDCPEKEATYIITAGGINDPDKA